jgi:hypothetical protein
MEITVGKIVGLVIALGYAAFAIWHSGVAGLKWSAALLLPLCLIWFSEEIGGLTGYYKTGYVNTQTPPVIISALGWLLLVGVPLLLLIIKLVR